MPLKNAQAKKDLKAPSKLPTRKTTFKAPVNPVQEKVN